MLENRIDITERSWGADRPSMMAHNQDLLSLALLYESEHNELLTSWLAYMSAPTEETRFEVLDEAADVILFITHLVHSLGSTLEETVMAKRAYNITRYTADRFKQGSDYHQARDEARTWVSERDWKQSYKAIPE